MTDQGPPKSKTEHVDVSHLTSDSRITTKAGCTRTLREWSEETGVSENVILKRLSRGTFPDHDLSKSSTTDRMRDGLEAARVLWRQPDTMSLWAIPYTMFPGQSPNDLVKSRHGGTVALEGWIWLGSPGWFGNISRGDQALIKAFVEQVGADNIPQGPCEWCELKHNEKGTK